MTLVRARALAAVVVTCAVTLTPLVNDLCARTCEQSVDATCRQHAPRPASQCAHDHRVMSADVPRVPACSAGLSLLVAPVLVFAVEPDSAAFAFTSTIQHSPPLTFTSPTPLRI